MTRVRIFALSAALVGAIVAGCSGTSVADRTTPTSPGSPTPSSSATPTANLINGQGAVNLSDRAGNKLRVSYRFSGTTPRTERSTQQQGKASVRISGSFTVTLTNQTPQRNVTVEPLTLTPLGLFLAASPACSSAGAGTLAGGYCVVPLGGSIDWNVGETGLAPDSWIRRTNAVTTAMITSRSQVPALIEALEHPSAVVIGSQIPGTGKRWSAVDECDAASKSRDGAASRWVLWGPVPAPICR